MQNVISSIRMVVVSMVVCCLLYTGVVRAVAVVWDPDRAAGSLIRDPSGVVIGSRQIAQKFTRPEYFWPRPSAVDYNAAATGGSNLSPTNSKITERAVVGTLGALLVPATGAPVPAELLAASGSGMDPHITEAGARYQAARVAAARGMPVERVEATIARLASSPDGLGIGERIVNVLELNLTLDEMTAARTGR